MKEPNDPTSLVRAAAPDLNSWPALMTTLATIDPATQEEILLLVRNHLHDKTAITTPTAMPPKTNYLVHLIGPLKPGGHLCVINQKITIHLELVHFLLLLALACHARTNAGLESPVPIMGGICVTPARLNSILQDLQRREPGLKDNPKDLSPEAMHEAKWDIRARLDKAGVDPDLLEGLGRAGYRISTLAKNITITLVEDDQSNLTYT